MRGSPLPINHNEFEEDIYKHGIYIIYHKSKPGVYYVGSTRSMYKKKGFINRWRRHLSDLNVGKHVSKYLQRVVNKYGLGGLFFEIIEIVDKDNPDFGKIETSYIEKYKAYEKGYNSTKSGETSYGFKMPEHIVATRRKPVLQYSLEGDFIAEYSSRSEVKKLLNIHVNDCLTGKYNICGDYIWKEKTDDSHPLKIDPYECSVCKRILVYTKQGDFIKECESVLKASKEFSINHGSIIHVLNGDSKFYQGYVFKHYDENYPLKIEPVFRRVGHQMLMKITDLTTGITEDFTSLREMCKHKNVNRQWVSKKLKESKSIIYKKQYQIEIYE